MCECVSVCVFFFSDLHVIVKNVAVVVVVRFFGGCDLVYVCACWQMTVFSWPQGHSGVFKDDLLTAEPEFAETDIGPGDDFLLMACDGLWDVLGKKEAVEHAQGFFEEVGFCLYGGFPSVTCFCMYGGFQRVTGVRSEGVAEHVRGGFVRHSQACYFLVSVKQHSSGVQQSLGA